MVNYRPPANSMRSPSIERGALKVIGAIFQHLYLLFTFRHNGAGLPSRGPIPYLLLAGAAVTTTIRGTLDIGDFISAFVLAVIGIGIIVFAAKSKPALVAPIALACLGGDSIAIITMLASQPILTMVATVWQIAAITFFSIKHSSPEKL